MTTKPSTPPETVYVVKVWDAVCNGYCHELRTYSIEKARHFKKRRLAQLRQDGLAQLVLIVIRKQGTDE